jgi:hypothetical protein
MSPRYVVDTNVLIAASAGDPVRPKDIDATPSDPDLRRQVWVWLDQFCNSDARMVLDTEGKIYEEYTNSKWLGFNDFGIQVVMHKWSTAATDDVHVEYDADGNGVLPASLVSVIHDLADRKMVAAALEAVRVFGQAPVAFAGDTDWHEWENQLIQHGVELEPIIELWSRAKFAQKKLR